MKKRIISALLAAIMLSTASVSVHADSENSEVQNEVTREEIITERPEISRREATISMLLDAGWTMEEIDEWYTEEALLELDEHALAVSNTASYIVNHENIETGEVISEEISRQEFDYGVNKEDCKEEDHENTNLSTLSSNGVLELQPIYGWGDMDHITANDRIYFGYGGTSNGVQGVSGASIWNNDSSCYLKQNMGMVWMGNDEYQVQYRFEWKKEPYFKIKDYFAVSPATDLLVSTNPRQSFTFKYTLSQSGNHSETCTTSSQHCDISNLSYGQGRQVKIHWPFDFLGDLKKNATDLKGFLTYQTHINNKYTYQEFVAYAQYYHCQSEYDPSLSISFSTTGVTGSFSVNHSKIYHAETHPMEVRAKNIYKN